jgi:hypothetical protein
MDCPAAAQGSKGLFFVGTEGMRAQQNFGKAAVAAALLGTGLAHASPPEAPGNVVKIAVTGEIQPSCASSIVTGTLNVGDIAKAGSAKVSFTVDCNTPFQYSMRSEHGAMRLETAEKSAARRDASRVPYDVTVKIPLSHGGEIVDACSSANLRHHNAGCTFSDSGRKIAVNQTAEMQISWLSSQQQLGAGQYSDRLTFVVSARP